MNRAAGLLSGLVILAGLSVAARVGMAAGVPLGLPPVPVPSDNPISAAKIALGQKLFSDKRFSSTGLVSCSSCHAPDKAFTDSPLQFSVGIHNLEGTRNAPTLANAAYFKRLFWDGRTSSLEEQSRHPFVNPVEMGLHDYAPILQIVHTDAEYQPLVRAAFGEEPSALGIGEVKQAIATFERTLIFGDSPFDRWYFGHEAGAISAAAQRGFQVFLQDGRCVSCHTIEQDFALFTDNRFHNIGVGINRIRGDLLRLTPQLLLAKARGINVDKAVLGDADTAEFGRFALSERFDDLGAFKTPTLRNVAVTAPYMHDGSLETLRAVVDHYNNGGVTDPADRVSDYLSGGIRPLHLTEQQINDLIAFMEALTSPQFAALAAAQAAAP
jgi:cytochrome c peroxidase